MPTSAVMLFAMIFGFEERTMMSLTDEVPCTFVSVHCQGVIDIDA